MNYDSHSCASGKKNTISLISYPFLGFKTHTTAVLSFFCLELEYSMQIKNQIKTSQ